MKHGLHPFALLHLENIDDVGTLGSLTGDGDLIALLPVDLSAIGEEEEIVMGGGGEDIRHIVLIPGGDALLAHAALGLGRILADGGALDVARLGEGEDALLLFYEILNVNLILHVLDLGLTVIAVLIGNGGELFLEDLLDKTFVREDPVIISDPLFQFLVFPLQLFPVKTLEGFQAHIQNRLGLDLIQSEASHQCFLGVIIAGTDDLDDLVNIVLGDEQTLQQVGSLLGLFQVVLGAADDDLFLEGKILVNDMPQGEDLRLRLVIHQGQHIDGKGGLELGLGEQAVEHHLGIGVPLELDNDAHTVTVGFIPDIGNALQALVLHLLRHGLDEHPLVHNIGKLGDDDAGAVLAEFLEFMAGTDHHAATAGGIGGADAAAAHDNALGGEVRALDMLHQVGKGGIGIVQHTDAGANDLPQVMGRNIGGHTNGDTAGTVYQEVGEAGGKDPGLLAALVKVGVPVHRLLVDIPEHLIRDFGKTGLGITIGSRGVAIHRAEVTVTIHQHIAHGEVLGKTHQGVVHRGVTMGVVAAQHVTHAGGGFLKGPVRGEVILIHGVEDTAVDRLETVTNIRQGTANDDAHGVLDVGFFHFGDQRGFHDFLVGVADLLRIVLGFFSHWL